MEVDVWRCGFFNIGRKADFFYELIEPGGQFVFEGLVPCLAVLQSVLEDLLVLLDAIGKLIFGVSGHWLGFETKLGKKPSFPCRGPVEFGGCFYLWAMFVAGIFRNGIRGAAVLATVSAVMLGYFLGQLPLSAMLYWHCRHKGCSEEQWEQFRKSMDFAVLGVDVRYALVGVLLVFVIALLFFHIAVRRFHRAEFREVLTGAERFRWRRFVFGFVLWLGLAGIGELLTYSIKGQAYQWQYDPAAFWPVVVIALCLLPIQVLFEEAFVRGYLLQCLSVVSGYAWVGVLLSSAIFAGLHGMNPEVGHFGVWSMMVYYFTVGVFLAVLAVIDDGLEQAIGIHLATNVFGALFVGYEGSALKTPALWKLTDVDISAMYMGFVLLAFVYLVVSYRLYGDQWKWAHLFRPLRRFIQG